MLTEVQKGVRFFCKSVVVVREFEVCGHTEKERRVRAGCRRKNACGSKSSNIGG